MPVPLVLLQATGIFRVYLKRNSSSVFSNTVQCGIMSESNSKSWIQEHLSALYTTQTGEQFHSAFENAFASDDRAKIIINGEEVSRDKFRDEIRAQRGAMQKAEVKFDELQDAGVMKGENNNIEAVLVKGTWTITRSLKFRIRAAPAQVQRVSTFQAKLEPVSLGSSDFRIVQLSETVENRQKPIVINPVQRNLSDQ